MVNRADLRALRDVIEEARITLATVQLPSGRAEHARELIESAVKQADAMLARPTAWMLAHKDPTKVSIRR